MSIDARGGRQPVASTLGHSTTRYPRRGRLTKLGPPKRTSRLSSDSMETPSEGETPPHAGDEKRDVSMLSAIPSSGTEEVKGLKGLIKLQQSQGQGGAVMNGYGEYTPPASQPSPPSSRLQYAREMTPPSGVRESTPQEQERRESPVYRRTTSPVVITDTPNEFAGRRVLSSSTVSSNTSTRVSSTRSIGRSSLRNLLASTSPQQPQPIDIALEGVQRGLEALNVRKDPTKVLLLPTPIQILGLTDRLPYHLP